MSTTYLLENVSCAGCVKKIETCANGLPNVESAQVNFPQRKLVIEGNVAPETVIAELANIGYRATRAQNELEDRAKQKAMNLAQYRKHMKQSAVALALGVPMMLSGFFMEDMQVQTANDQLLWGAVAIATLWVMFYSGRHFFTGALTAIKNSSANMDTLVAIGTGAAWFFSVLVIAAPTLFPDGARHIYLEATVMIIGLVNLGVAMEIKARTNTSDAVERLLNLQPKTARIVTPDGERDTLLELVKVGDLIRVLPGEQIPVDAKVVEGQSYIDESMLTGEPVPVAKNVNDTISAGTINTTGSLLIRADKVGSDTALSRIIELIKQAQNSKPDIARLADKISSVFVPTVIVISIFTALAWYLFGPEPKLAYMLITAITVLIIACPCALGLATPMSVMVGVGKAAENGVLTRNAQALQTASKINTLILDKTGTVTEGKPKVSQVVTLFGNEEDLLRAAASIEQHSEHPLATAILDCAKQRDIHPLSIENFVSKTGRGIKCTLNGAEILLGNKALMSACNVDVSQATEQADQLANQAHTVVYVAKSGQLLGLISIADPIREDSAAAIQRLNSMGIRIIMVTGDNAQTAKAIAHQAGINEFRAEARPEDKASFVKELQSSGLIVGIAGDGINDAPALAQADVGFAMGNGTDIAIESADMVLIRSSLHSVADAIELSNATLKNIKQNLFGAFIYNTLGIPVAAGILFPFTGVLLSPIIAGAAMAFSSATVVGNANRLRLFKTTAPRK